MSIASWYEQMNKTHHVNDVDWDAIPKISDNAAVIFEPRVHPTLPFTLRNHMYYLAPHNFSLTIFHSKENEKQVKSITGDRPNINFVCFTDSNSTRDEYNNTLKTVSFYESIPCKKMLIFQTDSWLRKKNMNEFLDYGFIGAPHCDSEGSTMNGGLSLRDKQMCMDIIRKIGNGGNRHEDTFFSRNIFYHFKDSYPSVNTAKKFASEKLFSADSTGVHKFWNYIRNPQQQKVLMSFYD